MSAVGRVAGGGVRLRRRSVRMAPVVAILCVILLLLILPPALFLLMASFHTTTYAGAFDQFTFQFYRELIESPFFFSSFVNSTIYATGSAVVGLILGTLQAVIVERTNTPGRQFAFLGAIISLGIPHVLYTVAWLLILGRSGPLNDWLMALGADAPPLDVYSMWGMILIEGVSFVPLTFLLMSAVLRSTDAAFEEASMLSGAGPFKTFKNITLRMGMPGVLALLLLSFIRAFESFEVPALVGLAGDITVLTTNIYQS